MGKTVAIDGSDMPAYANGHKHVGNKNGPLRTRWADPNAGWGHRSSISTRKGGAFYGYKLHCAVDTATELPLAWTVKAAKESEQAEVGALLDTLTGRGFTVDVAVLDKGYDGEPMYEVCESRHIRPVIALKETQAVKDGKHKPRSCDHGEWTFAVRTPSGAQPSGAAPQVSASPRQCGSRPTVINAEAAPTVEQQLLGRFLALPCEFGCCVQFPRGSRRRLHRPLECPF